MREAGPAFIEELMEELRVRHLGVPPKPRDGPSPFERLDTFSAAAAHGQVDEE
jgi:hypothetical protein